MIGAISGHRRPLEKNAHGLSPPHSGCIPLIVNRSAFLALPLFLCACALGAAPDSPAFVVKNQPAVPTSPTTPPAARVTLSGGRELGASLEGAELSFQFTKSMGFVLDPHASPGCPPALVSFADDSALLIWRGHGADGVRDLLFVRYAGGKLQTPARLNPDDWHSTENPAGEGPAVDARGAHVAVAWFTAADGPRVNVSTSSNAGIQWLIPNRVDDVAPLGRVSIVLLDDGAQLVSWVERPEKNYTILLRRISSRGTLSVPVRLVELPSDPGHPRLTRIKDGDATPAQLRLDYQDTSGPAARLITLPDASLLAEADACDCDPRPEDQRGYALKGLVGTVDPQAGTIMLTHGDIPGVMKARTTTFKAAPDLIAAAQTGRHVFARTERIGPDWWLFNLQPLATP